MPIGIMHVPREPEQVITQAIYEHSEDSAEADAAAASNPVAAANNQNEANEPSPATPPYQPLGSDEDWGYEPVTQDQIAAMVSMHHSIGDEEEEHEEDTKEDDDKENQMPDTD